MIVFNLPNSLSLSRIVVVPIILVFLSMPNKWTCLIAGLLFTVAALTDLIDGYLARRRNQITSFGKFLDPLADKLLISSVLIMLVKIGCVSVWLAILVICRDLMVTGLRAVAADEGVIIDADKYGKLKTVLQIISLIPLILQYDWFGLPIVSVGNYLFYLAVILTIFSGFNYFATFFSRFKHKDAQAIDPTE